MTKADIVNSISNKIGLEKSEIQKVVEVFMDDIKTAMAKGDNVYLRGFGTFLIKKRAAKTGRNISKNTAIKIPAHNVPAFKPSKSFVDNIKTNVKVTN
ncbi:integration host factor subunit beta [Apibacter muscae]|uniref:HU family DNA-binding protein n=1 Tax=Apibacter muscae TaxID=2509004 RepID=UPI0011ABEF5F|nr:HU family DNA-binding protein [Apibacter muscae]TWP22531.1 integration host factor subunit beta [Apibacter muscae]TWP27636.1 integration host factor subunit beta [Apibacter muscae]